MLSPLGGDTGTTAKPAYSRPNPPQTGTSHSRRPHSRQALPRSQRAPDRHVPAPARAPDRHLSLPTDGARQAHPCSRRSAEQAGKSPKVLLNNSLEPAGFDTKARHVPVWSRIGARDVPVWIVCRRLGRACLVHACKCQFAVTRGLLHFVAN